MALHRDIFWVGRQWAVTGQGLQAVDQKQKSKFDIEISRLWDDDLTGELSAERWFNADDFSKGLSIARGRYPAPGETRDVQPPQPFEPKPEPKPESTVNSGPPREPFSPPREIAPRVPPRPLPKADLPKPDLPKPELPKPELPKSAATPAAPSHDTWASLAELAKTAAPTPPRKAPLPEPIAPPKPTVFAGPAKPPPRFEPPRPASSLAEPPKRARLPFDMRIESTGAKFARMWRVRIRRQ